MSFALAQNGISSLSHTHFLVHVNICEKYNCCTISHNKLTHNFYRITPKQLQRKLLKV